LVENCEAQTKLECGGVKICPLPPIVTSVHQPPDAGIIACLKLRYKRRLISLVVRVFPEKRRRREAAAAAASAASDLEVTATATAAAAAERPPSEPAANAAAPHT